VGLQSRDCAVVGDWGPLLKNDEDGQRHAEPPAPFEMRVRLLVLSDRDVCLYVVVRIAIWVTLEKARHSVEPSRQL
jgi:hypothetical protein